MDDSEITACALAAGRGDRDAASAFIRATYRDVTRFLAHLAGAQHADDLAQDTYLRALRSLSRFAGRSSARTWLLAIARRVAVDDVRAAMARPRLANLTDWQAAADAATVHDSPRIDEDVVLRVLVTTLDADRREAFVATQVLGLSYTEAAEVCDCPIGTIRSRVARAREDLIIAMTEHLTASARRKTTG